MNRFFVPLFMTGALVVLGGTLLVVVVIRPWSGPDRSWRTHLNLTAQPVRAYTRSVQTLVSPEGSAPILIWQPAPGKRHLSGLAAGRVLYIAKGCGSCHGLRAQGGEVGPDLMDVSLSEVKQKVRRGPKGMPQFHQVDLTDEQVEQIFQYIKYLQEHQPPKSGRKKD